MSAGGSNCGIKLKTRFATTIVVILSQLEHGYADISCRVMRENFSCTLRCIKGQHMYSVFPPTIRRHRIVITIHAIRVQLFFCS